MAKTYNELYLAMRRALKEAGVEEYALEARRLLAQGAGYTDAQLIARMYMYAGDEAEKAAEKLLQRRLSGEPLAYIAGKWEFFGLEMIVTPAVLIPRMDTEPLVFTALEILKDVPEPRILDLCCGSGCIGCALGVNLPKARVIFADISPEALSVTRKNISLHRLNPRAVALEADALAPPPLRQQAVLAGAAIRRTSPRKSAKRWTRPSATGNPCSRLTAARTVSYFTAASCKTGSPF